jgi:hypothetical protein
MGLGLASLWAASKTQTQFLHISPHGVAMAYYPGSSPERNQSQWQPPPSQGCFVASRRWRWTVTIWVVRKADSSFVGPGDYRPYFCKFSMTVWPWEHTAKAPFQGWKLRLLNVKVNPLLSQCSKQMPGLAVIYLFERWVQSTCYVPGGKLSGGVGVLHFWKFYVLAQRKVINYQANQTLYLKNVFCLTKQPSSWSEAPHNRWNVCGHSCFVFHLKNCDKTQVT